MDPTSLIVALAVIAFCVGVVAGLMFRDSHSEYKIEKLKEQITVLDKNLSEAEWVVKSLVRDAEQMHKDLAFAKPQAPGQVRDVH